MPNLYEIVMLCESVYKNKLLIPNWQSIDKQVGQKEIYSGETGYYGEAFLHPDRHLIVIVHRGTKLYNASEKSQLNPHQAKPNSFISMANLLNDAFVALKYVPPETQPALDFALRVTERYPHHKIIQVGHSLGGLHANISGYFCKQLVVCFDPVGCLEILLKILAEMNLNLNTEQLKQHLNLLGESNLINEVNAQIGTVYQRKSNLNNGISIQEQSITARIPNTLATHKLSNFLQVITEDRRNLGLQVPDIFQRVEKASSIQSTLPLSIISPAPPSAAANLNHHALSSNPSIGVKSMQNSINGTHTITKENCVVSIVRNKGRDHCFLIIEGVGDNNERVTVRAELGYKEIINGDTVKHDKTKAQIYLEPTDYDWLQKKSAAKEFYFTTFELTQVEKNKLISNIRAYQNKDLDYVEFGNQNALAGGLVGASLDAGGSSETKNASIASNHGLFRQTSNPSAASAHSSVDASLHRGYSCVSWAIEAIQTVKPNYNPSLLGQLFVNIPQWEVNKHGDEHDTKSTCCLS